MKISQGVFLVAVLVFAWYATRLRSTLSDRIVYICLAIAGFVLVLYPDWSTALAHLIGIGRGVDLILYLFVIFSLFHYASSAATTRKLERAITTLVRARALDMATGDDQASSERGSTGTLDG